jgi:hypothetical protein
VFVSCVEPLIVGRPFKLRELLLGVVMVPGVVLVIGGVPSGMRGGIALGILSAFFVSVFGTLNKRLVHHADPLAVTAIELAAGALLLTVFGPLLMPPLFQWPTRHDAILLVALAVGCTILPFTTSGQSRAGLRDPPRQRAAARAPAARSPLLRRRADHPRRGADVSAPGPGAARTADAVGGAGHRIHPLIHSCECRRFIQPELLHFLSLNYLPGDDVFIFGFSRGAATARASRASWSGAAACCRRRTPTTSPSSSAPTSSRTAIRRPCRSSSARSTRGKRSRAARRSRSSSCVWRLPNLQGGGALSTCGRRTAHGPEGENGSGVTPTYIRAADVAHGAITHLRSDR